MDANAILYIIIGFLVFSYVLERILEYVNLKEQKTHVPKDLQQLYDEEKYAKSLRYHKELTRFSWITSTFSVLLTLAVLLFGIFGWLDTTLRPAFEDPRWLALAYFGILFIASDLLTIPFQLYSTFVIEEKYGFNRTTVKTFIIDKLKGYVLGAIVGGILIFLLLTLIINIGENFWLWLVARARLRRP